MWYSQLVAIWYSVRLENEELLNQDPPEALCFVLKQDALSLAKLFSTGSIQENQNMSQHDRKIVDWDVKH